MGIRIQNNDKSTATEIVSSGASETVLDANLTVMKDAVNGLVDVAGNKVGGAGSGLDADLLKGLPADFTSNIAANGYQKLPSGLIIQWGTIATDPNGLLTVSFPITFPNSCFSVTSSFDGVTDNVNVVIVSLSKTVSSFQVASYDNGASTKSATARLAGWIAIGY